MMQYRKRMSKTNETTKAIIRHLSLSGFKAWRNNTIGVYDPVRQVFRKNPHQLNGVPDIIGFSRYTAKFIAVEVKTGRDRASDAQKAFLGELAKAGGIAMIVKDYDDFIQQFKM
jgi:hypothetical protein